MKHLKFLAVALLLMPLALNAGNDPKDKAANKNVEQALDKYPDFNENEAMRLWGKWRHQTPFTQKDCADVIDLCNVAFDYLNADYEEIINTHQPGKQRERVAADHDDMGKSSNMVTFVRTFSNRMYRLALDGDLCEENLQRVVVMLEKKKEFKRLNQAIHE